LLIINKFYSKNTKQLFVRETNYLWAKTCTLLASM